MTAQVNVVNPGGAAQAPHRDYHLGFQSAAACTSYPASVHQMSAFLTLQGAVAHCDMPLASGPTLYLPWSQRYRAGFLAWQQLILAFSQGAGHRTGHNEQIIIEARDFLQAIASGAPVRPTFRDGYEVDRLVDAALRSMQERSWNSVR